MFWKFKTELYYVLPTVSLIKSELLKFYSGDLHLKSLVSEVYRTFLMLPFHNSFHLSIPVVQTDISHGTFSSSNEFGGTFFLFWKWVFPKEEKGIVFGVTNYPVCIDYIRHQKYFTFLFKRHITLSYGD